jgi:hypothetical protein
MDGEDVPDERMGRLEDDDGTTPLKTAVLDDDGDDCMLFSSNKLNGTY